MAEYPDPVELESAKRADAASPNAASPNADAVAAIDLRAYCLRAARNSLREFEFDLNDLIDVAEYLETGRNAGVQRAAMYSQSEGFANEFDRLGSE